MTVLKNYIFGKYPVVNYCIFYILLGLSGLKYGLDIFVFLFAIISLTFNRDLNQVLVYYISIMVFNITFSLRLYIYFLCLMNIILLAHFIIKVIKKEVKFNFPVFILFIIYALYLFLDFDLKIIKVYSYFKFTLLVSAMILVYQLKDSFNFKLLTGFFALALIYNFTISLFYSDKIYLYDGIDKVYRYIGFQEHPNIFAHRCVFLVSCLMTLKYYEKINDSIFLTLFAILYFMGLATISRIFLVGIFADCVLFAIFYIYKNKRDAFNLLIIMVAILCVISLICSYETNAFLSRIKNRDETIVPELSEEDHQKVLNGEMHYDYGRMSLLTIYLEKLLSNPIRIIFGYGYNAPLPCGQYPHNNIIAYVYYNGVFGLFLLGLMIIALIDKSKIKYYKNYLPLLLILCGFYVLALINDNTMFGVPFVMISVFCNDKLRIESQQDRIKNSREYLMNFRKSKF